MSSLRKVAGVFQRACVAGLVVMGLTGMASASDQWVKPTAEELSMTSVPGFPGVPAIYLYREEITRDDMHVVQRYERIKILTEKGKDRANVELGFVSSQNDGEMFGDDKTVGEITGRTIHADGTIIPFTGKPYLKTIEKGKDYKYQARVFTLPDVEVGSIIEYRYATRFNDNIYEAPDWFIQSALFTRAAHFVWYPTNHEMVDGQGQMVNAISWYPILPNGVTIQQSETPASSGMDMPHRIYEVKVKDVPPDPEEDHMPPIGSFTYRVLFNFTPYRTGAEYWKSEGKNWSKRANSFIGPDSALTAATQAVITGATTPDEKLHKIYAKIMELDNTDYTRSRGRDEQKAAGLGVVHNAADVLKNGRGNSMQICDLFTGMARAAGLKAYVMLVPNRNRQLFTPMWMNFSQFANTIAIVNIDGKDQFFSPGERYAPYGHLEWEYTFVEGLRQTDDGTAFAMTPGDSYRDARTDRVANLKMAENGSISGTINIRYYGSPALEWRQQALRGDDESLRHALRTALEDELPKTMEIKVSSIDNLTDYEKPLAVAFDVKGTLGTVTGKRLVLPLEIFTTNAVAAFPKEKRDLAVYFHYPRSTLDATRINLPPTMTVEAVPAEGKFDIPNFSTYILKTETTPSSVTVRRTFALGGIIVPVEKYATLRTFYSQFEAKDQESIVLKMAPASAPAVAAPAGN